MDTQQNSFKELAIGTILYNGKYIIEKVLGVGGFGITYYARHATLKQHFAIKEFFINGFCIRHTQHLTIHLQGIQNEAFVKYRQKFVEEAQMLAKLDHTGIVKVTDVFEENGTSYIVMPFIKGETLQSLIERNGKLPYEMGVNYMAQVCEALDYIHKQGILHRDVKPDNIMITPDNKTILIDFGSARGFVHDQTQSHTSILTQGYAPPEQYTTTGRKGSYSDIYSVGAVFYFIVTGKKPIDAAARLLENLDEPKSFSPELSDTANRTILKAMAIKPDERYQDVDQLMCELTGRKDWRNPVIIEKGKSNKGLIIGLVVLVLALLAGGGVWWWLENENKDNNDENNKYNQYKEQEEEEERIKKAYEQEYQRQISLMLNGQAENLKVKLSGDNLTYLQYTGRDLDKIDKTVWHIIVDKRFEGSSDNSPKVPPDDSFVYSGQMRDGRPHGKGEAKYDDGGSYIGSFQNGKRHGKGVRTFNDTTEYDGDYIENMAHGHGTMIYPDKKRYVGAWENNKRNGFGRYYDAGGNELYTGIWEDGDPKQNR